MAFHSDHQIYDALPISSDALDKGGVELLRVGVVDEELLITARRVFPKPAHWGLVLADVTRRLASLYAADGHASEAKVSAAIAGAFGRSLRKSVAGGARPSSQSRLGGQRMEQRAKPAKFARPRAKPQVTSRAKPSTNAVAHRDAARTKP